eukprot:13972601-Ditylum_brightwellii.AAC.2
MCGRTAATCIAVVRNIVVALLCLPFGSSPAPTKFCLASEVVFDLSNNLLANPFWNPAITHSPNQHLIPPPEQLEDYLPYHPALPSDVLLNNIPLAKTDAISMMA